MAGSKKPRKQYRPKAVPNIPIVFGLHSDLKTDLRLPYHISLENLRNGRGGESDATTLLASLMTARVLASKFEDLTEMLDQALDDIAGIQERGKSGLGWGVSGEQFKSISAALNVFDDMQDACTRREVRDALQKVWDLAA